MNRKIIESDQNQSELFIRTTNCLEMLKETLDSIQVQLTFRHIWFQGKDNITFWSFFNKFNIETEKKEEANNVKKFFVKYKAPLIP